MNRLVLLPLLLVAGLSQAAPITFNGGFNGVVGTSLGAFSMPVSFSLAQRSEVNLNLAAWMQRPGGGVTPNFDLGFESLVLRHGSGASQTLLLAAPVLGEGRQGGVRGFNTITQSYTLAPLTLDAGDWTLTLAGRDSDSKQASGFSLSAAANEVPLPGSLVLALAAFGGLALTRRRA